MTLYPHYNFVLKTISESIDTSIKICMQSVANLESHKKYNLREKHRGTSLQASQAIREHYLSHFVNCQTVVLGSPEYI